MRWKVPRMWEGKTVAILASGESMSAQVARDVCSMCLPTIAINTTYQLATWADMIYASDARWWTKYWPKVRDACPYALKVCCEYEYMDHPDIFMLKDTGKVGFDDDPACIRTGGNSGYAAVHVAVHAGATKVLLFGFDMRGGHWHERHPEPLRNAGEGIYERWITHFQILAPLLADRGVKVLNCTPRSAMHCFPTATLAQLLEDYDVEADKTATC